MFGQAVTWRHHVLKYNKQRFYEFLLEIDSKKNLETLKTEKKAKM